MNTTPAPALTHWKLSCGSTGHCWATLDKADSSSNTLSREVMDELETVITWLERQTDLPGVVFRSVKASGFILGADVGEFELLEDAATAATLAARGQALLQRIEDLPCPTVAILNGYTLGGGLELALACRYRVAIEGYERCIGLPEVQLGIHPGFGGTVRTIALLGVPGAALWGVLAFLCSFIPNVGYFIAIIPPIVFGALVGGWPLVLAVIVVYGVINAVVQSLVQPRVVGNAVASVVVAKWEGNLDPLEPADIEPPHAPSSGQILHAPPAPPTDG